MDRKLYQWISQLVRDKPDQATGRSLTAIGQRVSADYNCGYICNNRLLFSSEDKRQLRQRVLDEVGLDPFVTEQLPEKRLEMAQYHSNEKLASKPASDDQLLINSSDGVICINGEKINLRPASLKCAGLLCLNSSIRTIEHQTILVIENLAIMSLCQTWRISCVDHQALWVYRGDHKTGAQANACRDFLEHFGANKTVIVFSDMDPKGLEIAVTLPFAKFWLGPSENSWQSLLSSQFASQTGFDTQAASISYLFRLLDSNTLSEPFKTLISVMRDKRSSFRQEHTFSHNVPLKLIPIKEIGNY